MSIEKTSTRIAKRWLLLGVPMALLGGAAIAGVPMPGRMQAPTELGNNADFAKLSPEESLARSHQMSTQMVATESRVASLQKRAESKKDMVLVNCVADKLEQLHGHIAVGNAAATAIEGSIASHDDAGRAHNLERQTIVYQKVLVLGTEAEGCGGEDVNYTGATRVDVEIDPTIPVDDPTVPPASVIPTAIRPVASSAGS